MLRLYSTSGRHTKQKNGALLEDTDTEKQKDSDRNLPQPTIIDSWSTCGFVLTSTNVEYIHTRHIFCRRFYKRCKDVDLKFQSNGFYIKWFKKPHDHLSNSHHENLNTDIRHEFLNSEPNYYASHLVSYISNLPTSGIISSLWSCEAAKIYDFVQHLFAATQGSNWTICIHNLLNAIYILNTVSYVVTWTPYKTSMTPVTFSPESSELTYTRVSHENPKLHVASGAVTFTLLLRRCVAFLHRTATCWPLFKPWVSLLSTYNQVVFRIFIALSRFSSDSPSYLHNSP